MRAIIILFLCFSVFMLSGCAGFSKKDRQMSSPGLLEPQVTLKFNDIPVPAGFKLIPQDSYSFESAGVRVGLLKYKGKANPIQVINFYKEQMSMYSWSLLNVIEYGQCILNFEREQESCIVNMLANGKSITLTISVGPKSQYQKKTTNKPVK
ncbi:MAG: hypothetical protein WCL25_03475 [bacterium]